VIGEIIARKDLEYSFTKMVINMKVCGQLIKNMDKELIGETKIKN
jgi:hypothetical protein